MTSARGSASALCVCAALGFLTLISCSSALSGGTSGGTSGNGETIAERNTSQSSGTALPAEAWIGTGDSSVACHDGEIAVADSELSCLEGYCFGSAIRVFSRTAFGNVPPLRVIAGPLTETDTFPDKTNLSSPQGIAVDTTLNEMVVTNEVHVLGYPHPQLYPGSIDTFTRTASGNVAPSRTISALHTDIRGVALDTANSEIAMVAESGAIRVFARTATGTATPLRIISGAATGLSQPWGIAIDAVNNEIVVANCYANSITVYSRTASGNVAPLRTISGASTHLTCPKGVAVDTENGEIAVANYGNQSLTVYSRTASGNATPLRTITEVYFPYGIAIDTLNNEIAITNEYQSTYISVYSRTASGNAAPLRTISGTSTGLSSPRGIAVYSTGTSYCPSSYSCTSTGCVSSSTVDCGNGYYCPFTATCDTSGSVTECAGPASEVLIPQGLNCPSGYEPAVLGCIPTGSVDCTNGYYCPLRTTCDLSGFETWCEGIKSLAVCPRGFSCPSGYDCTGSGCIPIGSTECGDGFYCPAGSSCDNFSGNCFPEDAVDCGFGLYCPSGTVCSPPDECIPPGAVDCNNGYHCPEGMVCAESDGQTICEEPEPTPQPDGGSGYCSSNSDCSGFGSRWCGGSGYGFCASDNLCHCCQTVCAGSCSCLSCGNCNTANAICSSGVCLWPQGGNTDQ